MQLATIAATGPIFSLAAGLISWLLYKKAYKPKPSGLFFLMMAMVGIYSFLGPVAGTAFGGDFNTALKETYRWYVRNNSFAKQDYTFEDALIDAAPASAYSAPVD